MVERNGDDYAIYLKRVFADDPDFQRASDAWAEEEVQHGDALGRWATLADPGWDYGAAFARYRAGYKIDINADASIRGSRTGELIARCMVETGTSSYYTALGDATEEPVLQAGLPPDRGRRVPALQALLRPHEALPGARGAFLPEAAARRGRAHRRVGGRRAGLRLPLLQRGARHGLRPRPLHRRLRGPRLGLLPVPARRARHGDDLQVDRPGAARAPVRPRRARRVAAAVLAAGPLPRRAAPDVGVPGPDGARPRRPDRAAPQRCSAATCSWRGAAVAAPAPSAPPPPMGCAPIARGAGLPLRDRRQGRPAGERPGLRRRGGDGSGACWCRRAPPSGGSCSRPRACSTSPSSTRSPPSPRGTGRRCAATPSSGTPPCEDWTRAALAEGPARGRAVLEALFRPRARPHPRRDPRLGRGERGGGRPVGFDGAAQGQPLAALPRPGLPRPRLPHGAAARRGASCSPTTTTAASTTPPIDDEKRRRVLALVRGMRDRGVPIDAVGLQGHLHRDNPFSAAQGRRLRARGAGARPGRADHRARRDRAGNPVRRGGAGREVRRAGPRLRVERAGGRRPRRALLGPRPTRTAGRTSRTTSPPSGRAAPARPLPLDGELPAQADVARARPRLRGAAVAVTGNGRPTAPRR